MELDRLIAALSQPAAYPHAPGPIEVRQTHISVVFLAGPWAYKIKKPLDLGFVDYSTLARRRHFCDEEVRLNRRLAPEIYQGVVAVTDDGHTLQVEGEGQVVEWAVKMSRLPTSARLDEILRAGQVDTALVVRLGQRVAAFHEAAEAGPHIAAFGTFAAVARNVRENFEQSVSLVGRSVSSSVFDRLRNRTEQELARLRPLIESRAVRGVPRDTHGDLRLEHIYVFPQPPAERLLIIDCIEFNERFRFADPVCDIAFLAMDFRRLGRGDFAQAVTDRYFSARGDDEGLGLVRFYLAYRAAVRAKVGGMKAAEPEVPESERERALQVSRACWLLALGAMEEWRNRPCLALVGGLPGTGKSTLARALAEQAGFAVIRSDVVRKELVARAGLEPGPAAFGQGSYTLPWNEQVYAECLRQAQRHLFEGERVLVDATFAEEQKRSWFLEAARECGVAGVLLACEADPTLVRQRLASRRADPSDANWQISQQMAAHWQPPSPQTARLSRSIRTENLDDALAQAVTAVDESTTLPGDGIWTR